MTSCDRTVLVEARFDGRLGKAEAASLERHLPTCDDCSSRLRELEAVRADLRELAVDDVTPLAHQRARLVLLRKAAEPTHAPRKRRALWLGVALVFAPAAVFAANATLHALASSETSEAPSAPAPAPATSAHGIRDAKVAPNEPASADEPESNEAADNREPAPSPRTASAPAGLPAPSPRIPSTPAGLPAGLPAPSPRIPSTPAGLPTQAPSAATNTAEPEGVAARSPASRDFADAVDSVSRGDFGAGAAKLERFAQQYPQDARAEEALYLEAIALERAGRRDESRSVARRYLSAYPNGAHATQAHRLSE